MTDNSHRGLFFVATALMCAVSFYGSELARADPDELTATSSSGAPRQLTLPPGFKIEVASEQSKAVPIEANSAPCAEGNSSIPSGNCASEAAEIAPMPSFAAASAPKTKDGGVTSAAR
jgi:hypothetical protein